MQTLQNNLTKAKNNISKIALLLIAAAWIATFFEQPSRWRNHSVIVWDVQEYYIYLPAAFIYNDLNFDFVDKLPEDLKKHYWLKELPNGKRTGRFSIGMAIMYTPFFIGGHIAAFIGGQPQNGLSTPYHYALFLCGIVYGLLGLWMLRKILLNFFSDNATALTLFCIGAGTNFYYYATTEGPMTHVPLFFLFTIYIWHTIKWHQKPNYSSILAIAVSAGLAILIRPTSIVMGVFFLLYNAHSKNAFDVKVKLIKQNLHHFAILLLTLILIAAPQLIYWKAQTGNWVYYSYGKEGFFFNDPKIINGLFGFRKGWLVYTPIMALSLLGFIWMKRYVKEAFFAVIIYAALHIFVIFSWWCWWYGGSFGMRAMIEAYAMLALPMAALWQYLLSRKMKIAFGVVCLVPAALIYVNRFQTMQYRSAIIHWDSMTKDYYKAVFMKNEWPSDETLKLLSPPDIEAAINGKRDQ